MRRKTVQFNRLGIEISRLELLKPKYFVRECVAERNMAWTLSKRPLVNHSIGIQVIQGSFEVTTLTKYVYKPCILLVEKS